ncbi:7768_t:CDS:1 [Cetraspora pellucida]|uniref:7768_t:CDS:1 n=1 Tax=Cetraspora pellucida TaxID=1433469 RepID=A0A9N9N5N6_9GLOM|nr:7768_t:CDS:1 [Cetraspora pellucida]
MSEIMEYEMINKNETEVGTANNGLNDNIEGGSDPTNEDNMGNDSANNGLGSENEPKIDSILTNNPNNPDNILTGDPNDKGSSLENVSNSEGDPNDKVPSLENDSNLKGDPNDKGSSLANDNAQAPQINLEKMDIDNQNETMNGQIPENEDVITTQQQILKPQQTLNPENQNDNDKTQEISVHDKIALLEATLAEHENEIARLHVNLSKRDTELDEIKRTNHQLHQDIYHKDSYISNLTNDRNNLFSRNSVLSKSLDEVTKKNEELKNEAAHYQSKLGDAKNFKLSDDDPNNSTALTRDIEQLQDKINLYARVKKGVTLNLENAKIVLQQNYGCSLDHLANEDSEEKILIKWLLQRILIETVTKIMNNYIGKCFSQLGSEASRELELIHTTRKMIELLSEFDKHRDGIDEVTQAIPIKLRQQIYAVLGDRGFADIKDDKKEHPFISYATKEIDNIMSKFRTFRDEEKKQEVDKLLPSIIRDIVKIFFFRLKVQEPEATFRWFKRGDKIDPLQMIGPWDENIDQWFVDICYFPLIGIDLDNENNRKILFQAKVAVLKEKKGGNILKKIGSIFSPEEKRSQPARQQSRQNSSGSQPTTRQSSLNTKSADPNLQGDPRNNFVVPPKGQHSQSSSVLSNNNRTPK